MSIDYEKQLREAEAMEALLRKMLQSTLEKLLALGATVHDVYGEMIVDLPEGADQEKVRRIMLEVFRGKYPNPPRETILRLVEFHEDLYSRRLVSGISIVNIAETSRLRDIWRSIRKKVEGGEELNKEEKDEVTDAMESME